MTTYQAQNDLPAMIDLLNQVGATYYGMGAYEQAVARYEEARTLLTADLDPALLVETASNLGKVQRALGNYDLAATEYQQALTQVRLGTDQVGEIKALLNLGIVYLDLGQVEEAQAAYAEALSLAQAANNEPLQARAFYSLGKVYRDTAQYELALEVLEQALTLQQKLDDQIGEGATLNDLGTIYINLFQPDRAIEPLERALATVQSMGDQALEVDVLTGLALAYENQGETDLAIEHYKTAIAAAGSRPVDLESYQRLVKLLWDVERLGEAFTYMEKALAQTFLDKNGNPWIDLTSKLAPELAEKEQTLRASIVGLQQAMATEQEKLPGQRSQGLLAELLTRLDSTQTEYADVLERLRAQDPEYSAFYGVNPTNLDELRSKVLDNQTTLIEYFVLRKQAVAWVVDKNRAVLVPLDITNTELVNQLSDFYAKLGAGEAEITEASSLFARLFTPLRSFVSHKNLVIVPHGVLEYAPFAAFYDAQNGRYLVEDYAVTYAPSATLYGYILQKRNSNDGQNLVMGSGDDALPFARQSARAVGESLTSTPVMGQAATESSLYTAAPQVDILHLAAAGLYQPQEPLFSQITLVPDDENDGRLETHEIFSKLDLRKANLVVLAGNQLGGAEQFADGAEVKELAWAFHFAGTPAVLNSSWQVDDASVADFFASFYRHLADKTTTAEALRLAQVELLENEATAAPYNWAGFSLSGDALGEGTIQTVMTGTQTVQEPEVAVSQGTTDTTALTSSVDALTQSSDMSNVFQVRTGSEIAGSTITTSLTTTVPLTNTTGGFQLPVGDLTNGLCNNVTLPLGLVLLADLFRRSLRKKRDGEDEEA